MVDADSGFRDGDVWAIHSGRMFSAARKSISDVLKVTRPVLILFDCDGTLVDSQFSIIAAMHAAFQAEKLPVPAEKRAIDALRIEMQEVDFE